MYFGNFSIPFKVGIFVYVSLEREDRIEILKRRMEEMGVEQEELWWYLETRQFGSCPHSGFGLGFERLIMFVTGMKNVRDVIPFPRYPQNAEF